MIGIIITGHGQFASAIQSAVRMVTGEKPQIAYVDFTVSMSTDDLHFALIRAVDQVDCGDGVLFLTDIPGGSPFLQSAAVAADLRMADVISGANVVMAAEACIERETRDFHSLIGEIVRRGQENIKSVYLESQKQRTTRSKSGGI